MNQLFQIACIAVFLGLSGGWVVADEPVGIEGRWKIDTVELDGRPVPGLADAELVFADGTKIFTLPNGQIENGTYQLQAAEQPSEIDTTTEGKRGTEKGIYAIDRDRLTLCLATGAGERPREFASRAGSGQLLIVLRRASEKPADDTPVPKPRGTRRFRMGFTGFVYDITLEAVTASRKFVRENGDILAHHIEGVPWAEALNEQAFPRDMLTEWEGKQSAKPPGGQVYLAISPGRGDLKVAEKASPLPEELVGKAYDDPLVMRAYLNYCRRAIEFFDPDYLGIGIEVNEIHDAGPATWQAYVALHKYIYEELKKDHKDLPIFASWTLHNMFKKQGQMLADFRKLMPYNDLVAVSYYPFFVADEDRLAALDWMTAQFDPFNKPYAMVETNDAAERLPLPQAQVVIEGTLEKQEAYYRKLLGLAEQHDFAFVICFVHQDYDALWEKIKEQSPELFIAWRDCGLLDENGKARPALDVWKKFFDSPLQEP